MAIQNFLSGGFYGSIGNLTGRRWKNKRVVQTKFKPANPRTEAQQQQRMLFTRGSALAKIAQQVNWKAPQFENPIRTDWNQRQTIAINALKNGETEWNALPLAPTTFEAKHIIGTCKLNSVSEDGLLNVTFEGTNLLANKKYACAIFINSGIKKGQIIVGSTPTPSVDALTASFRVPESDEIDGEEVYIKIASIDDLSTDTVTLSAGILLESKTPQPYIFSPRLVEVRYVEPDELRILVKIGEEQIESYDPFTNTTIRIYDKVWTKKTAVAANILSTDNATNIDEPLNLIRTTVAKTTATVTFAVQYRNIPNIEKFAAKLDIQFNANNISAADGLPNSETLSLSAQSFPEYLQPICNIANANHLYINATTNTKINNAYVMTGTAYANGERNTNGSVLELSPNWENYEEDYYGITSITLINNKTYTGNELDELLGETSISYEISGNQIGFGLSDYDIKNYKGTLTSNLLFPNGKIAFYGYRVFTVPKDADGNSFIDIEFAS